jgi:hypothetical protein
MKFYCRYHPIVVACWRCPQCRRNYCRDCVPAADFVLQEGTCPQCRAPLSILRERRTELPFWQNLAQFCLFPLRQESLLLMLMLAALSLVALAGEVAALVVLALGLILLHRYAHATAVAFARGRFEAPSVQTLLDAGEYTSTSALLLANAVLIGPVVASLWFEQRLSAAAFGLLALLVAPALLVSVLRQQDFRLALKPETLLAPIVRMGRQYGWLSACLALAVLIGLIATDLFVQHAPPFLIFPACTAIVTALVLALASLFGYVLCQYDAFDQSTDQDAAKSRKTKGELPVLITDTLIDMALKDGELDKVIELLKGALKQKGSADLRRDQLYTLLYQRGDFPALLDDAETYLWRLVLRGQSRQAFDLLKIFQQTQVTFCLHDLELSVQLAELCYKQEEYKLLLWLARDGHKRFKPEPALARLYTLAADTLSQHFGADKKAAVFREYVQTHLTPSQ